VLSITYHVSLNELHGKLEFTISPSDEDDIGLLKGRSSTPVQEKQTDQSVSLPMPWEVEETFIGTNDKEIRDEAEAAIREMGAEIIDIEAH